MEAFPTQFCKGIRSHWRKRKYHKVEGSVLGKKTEKVTRLGGRRWCTRKWRIVFRIRVRLPSPVRLLARLRDAYVDGMLCLAGKRTGFSTRPGPEVLLARRIPKARMVRSDQEYFDRILLEAYKSLMASGSH